jgi:hypothetical protein
VVVGFLLGTLWVVAMTLFALIAGGAGHGNYLPLALVVSPAWVGFLVWPTVGALVTCGGMRWPRVLASVLLVVNYLGVAGTYPPDFTVTEDIRELTRLSGAFLLLYCATQVYLWWRIIGRRRLAAASGGG